MAEETHPWVTNQVEELYKVHLPRGLSKTARAEFRRTFKYACAIRVAQRIRQLTSENARALVVVQEELFTEAKAVMGKVKEARSVRVRAGSGTAVGFRAGDQVKSRKEVK